MTIQEKAKKLLLVLDKGDYLYKLAEAVSRSENVSHNGALFIERAYRNNFGKDDKE